MTKESALKFLEGAATAFNGQDIELCCADYTEDAKLEFFSDGVYELLTGTQMIRKAWRAVFSAIPAFRLEKELLAFDNHLIINEWYGSIDKQKKTKSQGIEWWKFDNSGKVIHHRLYSFLSVVNGNSLAGKLKFGIAHPLIGVRIENARRNQ